MGRFKSEINHKFKYIAVRDALLEVADVVDRAGTVDGGADITVTVTGSDTVSTHFSMENLEEFVEIIKLNALQK